jgi:hypothetical protein
VPRRQITVGMRRCGRRTRCNGLKPGNCRIYPRQRAFR